MKLTDNEKIIMKKKIQLFVIHGGNTFKTDKDYFRYLKTRPISLEKRVRYYEDYFDKTLGKNNVIGAGSKEEAWKNGIIHRIARIFLFNSKGELLITKRGDNLSSLPGRWDQSAAGHVDEGEDYPTAAKRELEEEVGVKNIELIEKGKFFTDETDETGKIKKRFSMLYTGKN